MIFDGKAFARAIEDGVKTRLCQDYGGRRPKIVSIMVGDHPSSATSEWHGDPASVLYTRLKSEAAKRVGIQFDVVELDGGISSQELGIRIREIGDRADVSGVMVQLPIPGLQGLALKEVLSAIPIEKDVDGLRWEESGIKPATVRAVLAILNKIAELQSSDHSPKIAQGSELWGRKFVVVGARGVVGQPLVHFLKERGVEVAEIEWDTPEPTRRLLEGEVVISCVGKAGLVTGEMVKEGVIAIDVGMSKVEGKVVGDMTEEVYQKASIAVPVPGGVGPVTIASLMANACELSRHLE